MLEDISVICLELCPIRVFPHGALTDAEKDGFKCHYTQSKVHIT